ncbi:phosphoglycerate dehydrogenase [Helicobacter sp. 12S02232-10]|uniref:phosphoglycerate dehydrogenase n=1 Tax=Helicobacter sp. 12S02232-10 TaxID=1476197 RepID=UPI000BA55A55|nr:phosphoglycerate dehydrogenase [Helicobacter sp. 12S02232-10]PAF47001.1 phosphoglycerate dehydrogenase [Helicobacter sp. 12S02232-10]
MHKIIVCDHIHQKGLDLLTNQDDIQMENLAHLQKDELLKLLKDADVIITRSSTNVDEKLLTCAKNLKAIIRAGVGVDNVDIDSCSRKGIVVMNVPTANTIAAVELTMAHIINAVRNFPGADAQLRIQKKWKREDWYGTELKGKKIGIIGFGNIGSRVGIRAKAFEMEVITYDPYIFASKATDMGIAYTENFEDILKCDIITIHTPKNEETKNMITAKEIKQMKEGVILINCARGGLYNEDDLYDALKSHKIRWAGIDVFNKEPGTDNKLLDLDNVYVTPHIGANTLESQEQIALQAAQAALEAARGANYPNALNLPVKEADLPKSVKAYLELTQKLGFFCAQANKGAITSVHLNLEGEIGKYADSLMAFALVGVLKSSLGDKINYINAQFIAKERGIEMSVKTKKNSNSYKNLVTISLATAQESLSASGTVFEEDIIKLTDINGFNIDIEPKGRMILFKNTDIPGVIGNVGNILGKHSINIADFRLSRNSNKEALALIVLDSQISENVIQELRGIPACISIRNVTI